MEIVTIFYETVSYSWVTGYGVPILQDIISLSSDTLKDCFLHLGGKVSNFTDIKNQTVAVHIAKRWGKDII